MREKKINNNSNNQGRIYTIAGNNLLPDYWSMINIRDRKIDRRGRTTTKIYIYNTFLHCFVIILDPCSKSRI